jgi:uncharacterized protein DUF6184
VRVVGDAMPIATPDVFAPLDGRSAARPQGGSVRHARCFIVGMPSRVTALATLAAVLALALSACSSSQQTPRARTTSAQINSAGSPDRRTTDNTGFVGPSGQTGSVSAGTGAAQIGRSEGVPPPQREVPAGGEAAPSGSVSGSPAPAGEPVARAVRALCDRESFCGRVGQGKAYGSADSCMADKRERIERLGPAKACGDTIRNDRLATCLAAIRNASCEQGDAPAVQPPSACTTEALCG